MLAGMVTAFLQIRVKISPILAGILTMTGLYSVCLQLQGGSPNISLLGDRTIFSVFLEAHGDMNKNIARMIVALIAAVIMLALTILFFKTRLGLCIRTTGDNEEMIRATSISETKMKTIALGHCQRPGGHVRRRVFPIHGLYGCDGRLRHGGVRLRLRHHR